MLCFFTDFVTFLILFQEEFNLLGLKMAQLVYSPWYTICIH